MNGKERLIWAQDASGYVYLTTFESPLKPGFERFSTTIPSEMDRIFAKLDKQEKERFAKMTEQMYNRNKDFIEQNLSNIRLRIAQSNNDMEKDILRAWLQAFQNKMDKLQRFTVYGVSAMQKESAPIPTEKKFITAEDIRNAKPETEVIQ